MNMITRIGALALSLAAPATAAQADGTIWDGLRLAGSQSLLAWSLSEPALPLEALAARNKILENMGYIGARGEITRTWYKFSPILTYDNDINGGFPGSSIVVSGLTFEIDEEYERVSGLMMGMSVSGGFTMPVADGLSWNSKALALATWSPEHSMSKVRIAGDSCLRKMLNISTYLNGCLDLSYSDYDLGTSHSIGGRVGISHAFAAFGALHEVQADLRHASYGGGSSYEQRVGSVRLTTAHAGGFATVAGLQLGSDVDGILAMRERIEFGISANIFGEPGMIMVSAQNNRGGSWLGEAREDRIYSLSLSRSFGDKFGATINISDTHSSAEFFNETAVGINFSYSF